MRQDQTTTDRVREHLRKLLRLAKDADRRTKTTSSEHKSKERDLKRQARRG
jgi:hypothetical protein